jgi:ABC-2 type transport system ATP-binding protein
MFAIEANDLTKRYGTQTAVDRVSFSVPAGSMFAFVGPNGSGKSTTVRMLCGLERATFGRAQVNGNEVARGGRSALRHIGYMAQGFALYDQLTCAENLEFCARAYGLDRRRAEKRKNEVIDLTGIARFLQTRAKELSGGWQRRLGLAAALLHDPPVLFLDEPTAGIDPVARRGLWQTFANLAANGKTFFITTHDIDEASRCERIGYIFEGKLLACDSPQTIRGSSVDLEEALVALVGRAEA